MLKVDPLKGTPQEDGEGRKCVQDRHEAIRKICFDLSGTTSTFHAEQVYSEVREYENKYTRWFYSDISNYLFSAAAEDNGVFLSNLEKLQDYAYSCCPSGSKEDCPAKQLSTMVDKLWDHANLAQMQIDSLRQGEGEFQNKFESNIAPHITKLTEDMNKQLISLVSIFTALSFIIFGGISSLDNIFDGAKSIPIIQLIIIGSIWGLCILNLVFTFSFLVSKLTKLSIKTCEDATASLSKRYPFWIWSNYIMLLVLSVSCWLYYIDYSNSGSWLIRLSQQHGILSALIGTGFIVFVFGGAGFFLSKNKKNKKS